MSYLPLLLAVMFCVWLAPGLSYGKPATKVIKSYIQFDREQAFIGEQILATITIKLPQNAFAINQSQLHAANADIYVLNKTSYTEQDANDTYHVVETRYALFAQSAGLVKSSAISITARLPASLDDSAAKQKLTLAALIKPETVTILPPPAASDSMALQRWLPASEVLLSRAWEIHKQLQPGTPVVRRITIDINGQHPSTLPPPPVLQLPAGLRSYPAPASITLTKTPQGVGGNISWSTTLVASRSGDYELPPMVVPWWNINEQQWDAATLPAETLSIAGTANSDTVSYWQRATIILSLFSALLIVLLWWLWRIAGQNATSHRPVNNEKNAWRHLRLHARTGNDAQLRQAIRLWLQTLFPAQTQPLDYIAQKYPAAFASVKQFDRSLYGQHTQRDAAARRPARQALMSALKTLRRDWRINQKHSTTADKLYPLSPETAATLPQPLDQSISKTP